MNASQMEQEVLREIPGYKAILKSVLKSQIQFLMEQMSDQTGEESVVLTASIHDGSMCALGSTTGRGFMDGKDEIKAQFLGYCIKSQHHKASSDVDLTYQRSRNLLPPSRRPKPRLRPGPYSIPSPGTSTPVGSPNPFQLSSPPNHGSNQSNTAGTGSIKPDPESGDMLVDSVSGDNNNDQSGDDKSESGGVSTNQDEESGNQGNQKSQKVKEGEDGGDAGEWDSNYDSAQGDDSNTEQDPNGLESATSQASNLGGIAFPGLNNAHYDFTKTLPDISSAELKNVLYQGLTQDTSAASNGVSLSPGANLGPYDLVPRKRGRPRKDSYLYMNEASQNTSVAMESPSTTLTYTNATDQAASGSEAEVQGQGQIPVQQFRRGRPRKEYENLPPGVIHPTGISIGNGYVKCNICGKILKGTSMFTHKQAHLGIRNYSCNYCGKSFTQKGPLITHERVHTGEKPYSCNMCGKSFSAHSGLYQHRRRCSRQSQFSQFNITM
ncbi:zinc finger protein with KRAB and SCAN domains 1-like isoform X2 [Mya arenaria]|uniref:zinc finger protein with KRAB and SCAN domains 1-like isoform X2 n=1 Tax=Mya arenaria TaxID=6604 RepID=UPI0022E5F3DA|nr:zinc finger protein with KRAB and SCAN domains 1-like isoform X2 [Mya arenaria]